MDIHAVEALRDTMQRTKQILTPVDVGNWLRLALMTVLTGGSTVMFPSTPSLPGETSQVGLTSPTAAFSSSPSVSAAVGGVFLLVIGVFIGLWALSSVFELVFFRAIIKRDTSIVPKLRSHVADGLAYFGFRVVFYSVLAFLVAAALAPLNYNDLGLVVSLAWIPIVLSGIFAWSVFGFLFHDLVLPEVIRSDKGLFRSWRSVWGAVRQEWRQIAAFTAVKTVLLGAMSTAVLFGLLFLSLALAVPIVLAAVSGLEWLVIGVSLASLLVLVSAGIVVMTLISVLARSYTVEFHDKLLN